jgi:hypothetical protein
MVVVASCGDNNIVYCDHGRAIELTTTSPFVEYRDGAGEWLVPERIDDRRYVLCVDDDYVVLTECQDAVLPATVLWQQSATVEDGPSMEIFACGFFGDPPPELHEVTGEVARAGTLTVGYTTDFSSIGPWHYQIGTFGPVDIVATDNVQLTAPQAIVGIRRGIQVDADTEQRLFDLATEGIPMVPIELPIPNLDPAERLSLHNEWITPNAFAPISMSSTTTFLTVPDELVAVDDLQQIDFWTSLGTRGRGFVTYWPGEPDLSLLPLLPDDITFDKQSNSQSASWNELPSSYTDLSLRVQTRDIVHTIRASRSWIERTGATSLALDRSSPHFDPGWSIPSPLFFDLDVIRETELSWFFTSADASAASQRPTGCEARERSLRGPRMRGRGCHLD